jgi:hypothetical protein
MGVRHIGIIACAVLALCWSAPGARAQTDYQGMSLFGWGNGLANPDLSQSLYDMHSLGVDTVALNVWWRQDTNNSNTIYENVGGMSASMAQISHAIDLIHGLGMQVYLKPNVDSADGTWRAQITPSNPAAWFSSYSSYINTMADLAQAKGVALFSVGTEMESMANPEANAANWSSIVSDVRSRYDGKVTYAANHGDVFVGSTNHGSYEDVPWWNQLDYIGVDAYFPLTSKNNPTLAELQSAWTSRANAIEAWRQTRGLTQPVLFTEVGYGAYDGSNRTPWGDNQTNTPDPGEQRDAYEALLSVLTPRPWFEGVFWWSWETSPNAGLMDPMGFTPQDRPAQQTLADYYGGVVPPGAPPPPPLISRWDESLEGYAPQNGASIATSTLGVTQGSGSLAVISPNSNFRFVLQKTFDGSSGAAFRTWQEAAADRSNHLVEFDVTYLTDSIPQTSVSDIRVHVALNSEAGWSQRDNFAVSNGRSNTTMHVSIPLSQFNLAVDSPWYQFNLLMSGNWGGSPATVYVDNLRLTNLSSAAAGADFDGDGAIDGDDLTWWRYGAGGTRHGDADGDGDTDGADFLVWQRQLAPSGATAVPEPGAGVLAVFFAIAVGCRAFAIGPGRAKRLPWPVHC